MYTAVRVWHAYGLDVNFNDCVSCRENRGPSDSLVPLIEQLQELNNIAFCLITVNMFANVIHTSV